MPNAVLFQMIHSQMDIQHTNHVLALPERSGNSIAWGTTCNSVVEHDFWDETAGSSNQKEEQD